MKDGRRFRQVLEIQCGGPPDVMALYFEDAKAGQYMCFDYSSAGKMLIDVLDSSNGKLQRFNSLKDAKQKYRLAKNAHIVNLGWITEDNLSLN